MVFAVFFVYKDSAYCSLKHIYISSSNPYMYVYGWGVNLVVVFSFIVLCLVSACNVGIVFCLFICVVGVCFSG